MHIEGTRTSPSIDANEGIFEIKGRSIPEDAYEFYSPLLRELSLYIENPRTKTEVHFHLEYINSGSKKYVTNFLAKLNEFYQVIPEEQLKDSENQKILKHLLWIAKLSLELEIFTLQKAYF